MIDPNFSLDDLVQAQRKTVGLDPSRHASNRKVLLARVAGAGVAGVVASGASKAAGSVASGVAAKLVVVMSLLGAVGASAYYLSSASREHVASSDRVARLNAVPRLRPPPNSSLAPPPDRTERPVEAVESLASARKVATVPKAASAKPESTAAPVEASLTDDVRLMHQVSEALRSGRAAQALALLNQDARRATGAMREEKSAARVVTLCQLGRVAEARSEAAMFERQYPRSPLVFRVRSSCGGETTKK